MKARSTQPVQLNTEFRKKVKSSKKKILACKVANYKDIQEKKIFKFFSKLAEIWLKDVGTGRKWRTGNI